VKLAQLNLFRSIHQTVKIAQKTVKLAPAEKLYDAFITLLVPEHTAVNLDQT